MRADVIRFLSIHLRGLRAPLAGGLVVILVARAAGLLFPAAPMLLIDRVIGEGRYDLLAPTIIVLLVAALVQASSGWVLARMVTVPAQLAIAKMKRELVDKVLGSEVMTLESGDQSSIAMNVIRDADLLRIFFSTGLLSLIGLLVTALLSAIFFVTLHAQLGIAVISLAIAVTLGAKRGLMWLVPMYEEQGRAINRLSAIFYEILSAKKVITLFRTESYHRQRVEPQIDRWGQLAARGAIVSGTAGSLVALGISVVTLVATVIGVTAVMDGDLEIGELVTVLFLTELILLPLLTISSLSTQIAESLAALQRIGTILEIETQRGQNLGTSLGAVGCRSVTFEYGTTLALERATVRADPGTMTLIVGSNGSGKSTLLHVLAGIYSPKVGRVFRSDKMPNDGYATTGVLQDAGLFEGSLGENVRVGRSSQKGSIRKALKLAGLEDFREEWEIRRRGAGWTLSSGEKQRVCLARALYSDPQLLLLDEPFANVDAGTEKLLSQRLRDLRRSGVTIIMVTHRLDLCKDADKVLVMSDGRVAAVGQHDVLLRSSAAYRMLWNAQQCGAEGRS